ncbi:histidine phosphatase family protein [Georgenia sp. SUBG003]|uniref:histidine phosphatase family protein n=1 Tax=Georgenia sp. SUBG003 TaxID=1497974 RepID=UPI003AB5BEC4
MPSPCCAVTRCAPRHRTRSTTCAGSRFAGRPRCSRTRTTATPSARSSTSGRTSACGPGRWWSSGTPAPGSAPPGTARRPPGRSPPVGQTQSENLVPLLSAYGVEEIMTSPWERCAATVRPYLEASGIGAELRPELTEAAHERRARPVRNLVRRELTTRDVPAVICTHRPVLPTVVEEVAERTPHRIMKQVPESDPWLRTAEMLVVHVAKRPGRGAVVAALEKHRASS